MIDGNRNTARDIVGVVASITEDDPGVLSEELPTTPLVDRDSSTRWASCLDVQFDVADLCFLSCCVRRREAAPALKLVASLPLWLARTVHIGIRCGTRFEARKLMEKKWYSRPESNRDLPFRKRPLYPFELRERKS